jgi:hypothetical protein
MPTASKSKPGKRKHPGGDPEQPKSAAASQTPAESPPTIAADPTPAPEPEPTPSAQPKPGSIHLFATGAICYPSLDDPPATMFMPRYPNVPAGHHTVYCTRNKGGQKELVGEIDLPPGAKIERTVTQADGKLVLARPR